MKKRKIPGKDEEIGSEDSLDNLIIKKNTEFKGGEELRDTYRNLVKETLDKEKIDQEKRFKAFNKLLGRKNKKLNQKIRADDSESEDNKEKETIESDIDF